MEIIAWYISVLSKVTTSNTPLCNSFVLDKSHFQNCYEGIFLEHASATPYETFSERKYLLQKGVKFCSQMFFNHLLVLILFPKP